MLRRGRALAGRGGDPHLVYVLKKRLFPALQAMNDIRMGAALLGKLDTATLLAKVLQVFKEGRIKTRKRRPNVLTSSKGEEDSLISPYPGGRSRGTILGVFWVALGLRRT